MKKSVLLFSLFIVFTITVSAQKPFAGTVTQKTRAEGTTDANIISQSQSERTTTILGNKLKTEASQDGIGIIFIEDGENMTNTFIIDLSIMGFGSYYKVTPIEDNNLIQFDYTYDVNDTKEIAGYKCYKAVCVTTDLETDETETITFYISDDFIPNYKSTQFKGLKGFPFYTAIEAEDSGSPYTIVDEVTEVKVSKKVKSVDFLLPEGAVSFDEAPAELKAMFGLDEEE